jgi:Na+/proline symporter
MLSPKLVLLAALAYVAFLFAVAFFGDRQARKGQAGLLQSPLIYTLSLSIYCTSWTFYGAVGSAARNGLEFVTIYLGPTLVFVGWWFLLRKLVRIGRVHRVTSIADLISSRYGKSTVLAVIVTLIAVIGTTPYIALQLKALTISFQVVGSGFGPLHTAPFAEPDFGTAFWIAGGMAVFTIIFGTRTIDANERHHGVVAAIAVEAVVKLIALLAVGLFVVFSLGDGFGSVFAHTPPGLLTGEGIFGPRWVALTFLAATAIICLPRQFQVMVVENTDERHLRTAS